MRKTVTAFLGLPAWLRDWLGDWLGDRPDIVAHYHHGESRHSHYSEPRPAVADERSRPAGSTVKLFVVLMLGAQLVPLHTSHISRKAEAGKPYADINHAAHDALADAARCSHNTFECGTVIWIQPDGQYVYSAPISSERPFGVDLGPAYASALGPIVADAHVHVCSIHNAPFADFFSASDAIANQGLGTVGYMLSECDWNIRRYDPAQDDRDDEEVDFKSGKVLYLTIGHIAGWLSPDDRA
jgi:hypothetical protein